MKSIPYAVIPAPALRRLARPFYGVGTAVQRRFPDLEDQLRQAGIELPAHEYIAGAFLSDIILFLVFSAVLSLPTSVMAGIMLALLITIAVALQQLLFPRIVIARKVARLESQLLPALRDLLVQLNAGVPLFTALRHIATSDYGEVSHEFSKAVASISAGENEAVVLRRLAEDNPSPFFRRTIWQLSNSMKAGSDVGDVLAEIIDGLADEQIIQLQNYGSQLNPLAMMYMLFAIIVPSLGVTFIVLFSSLVKVEPLTLDVIFASMYAALIVFQTIFIGIVKARRPHLL
ncbi:MAG: type II secretion system F family protein [Nanoarchaeota archaeon]